MEGKRAVALMLNWKSVFPPKAQGVLDSSNPPSHALLIIASATPISHIDGGGHGYSGKRRFDGNCEKIVAAKRASEAEWMCAFLLTSL